MYDDRANETFDEIFGFCIPTGKKVTINPYIAIDNPEDIFIYEVNQYDQTECRRWYQEYDCTPYVSSPTAREIIIRVIKRQAGPNPNGFYGAYFSWTFSDL